MFMTLKISFIASVAFVFLAVIGTVVLLLVENEKIELYDKADTAVRHATLTCWGLAVVAWVGAVISFIGSFITIAC